MMSVFVILMMMNPNFYIILYKSDASENIDVGEHMGV